MAKKFGIMFHDLAASAGIFLSEDRAGLADWEDRWRPIYQGKTPLPFVLTQIRSLLIRVRTNSDPLSPIIINRRSWSALLSRLGVELGLPALIYWPTSGFSAGRGQAALGFLSTVRDFCASHGLTWNPDLWAGTESAPIRTITYRIAPEPEEDPALAAEREEILKAIFTP